MTMQSPIAPHAALLMAPMPPVAPTLPQMDTPAQQAARAAQLAASRTSYIWDTEVPTLPGVPLAAAVPADNLPALAWWGLLIDIALGIVRNALAVKLGGVDRGEIDTPRAKFEAELAECDAIEASAALLVAPQQVAHESLFGHLVSDLEAMVARADRDMKIAALRAHKARLEELMKIDDAAGLGSGTAPTLEAYRALFDTLPVPGIAWTFQDDAEFAALRVAGPNAMLIEAVGPALPANFPLTSERYAAIVNGDTLAAALAEGRLFKLDYRVLGALDPGSWGGLAKYVWQPIALFAVPPGGASLVPVAIQCGQDADEWPIFAPSVVAADQWGWEMAKLIVQIADGNYHELVAHLGRTHLVVEAVAMATHRHLATVHPIWALLVPHFEGTLFINEAAATSLIAPDGPIDHIFAGTIQSTQGLAVAARLTFDFTAKMLPHDLATRGVGPGSALTDFPYRDDALLVWEAIHDWAHGYVDLYYVSDADVTGDTELAAWATCLATEAKLSGFGPIASRAGLVDACTMILFTASAQHAAVNFPQKDVMAFAPAVTGAGWQSAPPSQAGQDKPGWLAMMPPMALALEQLNVLELLGSLHYRPLGDYRSTDYPYAPWFQDPRVTAPEGPLPAFQAHLANVETVIAARNAERRRPYPYLQPSLIPTSINI
ncbi:lipoxygenase family protein [Sphingomonas sp. SUN039]|uniref:lipoxygenase family protein n=1 Tax=Sphingomonas sp. SUN039 TaxID=2937787 RepID=UPI0021646828|nr:lipoxygenase family protein [Sphingomonas sp. SUN039]UVO54572.1 arachidonate 15-lipoxygenase [Sphingomonas sp. SUN039]